MIVYRALTKDLPGVEKKLRYIEFTSLTPYVKKYKRFFTEVFTDKSKDECIDTIRNRLYREKLCSRDGMQVKE